MERGVAEIDLFLYLRIISLWIREEFNWQFD